MAITVQIIGGILGILALLIGFLLAIYKMIRRIECDEESIKQRKDENIILIKATLAICDGLTQLGANGAVKDCKAELQKYLIERSE